MTKPTVFNYKNYEELRQAYKELLADNQQLVADNRKLRQEVTELKLLNDGYVKIIAKNQETNNKLMASTQFGRPHGEWYQIKDHKVMGEGYMWHCSICDHKVYQDSSADYPRDNFCPNCGADMRKMK